MALRETVERAPRVSRSSRWPIGNRISSSSSRKRRSSARVSSSVRAPIAMLVPEDSEGYESMLEALASAPVLGTDDGGDSRQRQTQGAHGEHRGHGGAGDDQSATATRPRQGIGFDRADQRERDWRDRESPRPRGSEAISWVLLTNLPVPRLRQRGRESSVVREKMGH